MPNVIQCPTCGASVDTLQENCSYCGNFLLHLSSLELKKDEQSQFHFRSLRKFYKIILILSLTACGLIYSVLFPFLSEEKLVLISPLWFLGFHFAMTGLFTEKSVRLVLERKETNFKKALEMTFAETPPLQSLMARITFLPLYLSLPLKNVNSPLKLSLVTTVMWAVILYFFFVAIFPML